MKYRLRYLQHDFELVVGRFVIGRAADCQLSLDDPLVSRHHALLSVGEAEIGIEDLGSRNGVQLNGAPVASRLVMKHGDRIEIGSQQMLLLRTRDDRTQTQVRMKAAVDAVGLLANLADKAFALGRGLEAERILSSYLEGVASDLRGGLKLTERTVDQAAEYASRLALATGKGRWVNYIVGLYAPLHRPCPAVVVDGLYSGLRKVDSVDRASLRAYVEDLKARAATLGPNERFLVSRLEGLERLAALK